MIKLTQILKEITTSQKATSWLDPQGEFHFVDYNHGSTAYKLTGDTKDPMMILWKKGWQRVTYYSQGTLYCNNEVMPPNYIQKRKLIELTEDLGFTELRYDGGEDTKILWSKEDLLETI